MINTELTVRTMPRALQAYRKYIEKYLCYYLHTNTSDSVVFYHAEKKCPYLILAYNPVSDKVHIYENTHFENLSLPDCLLYKNGLLDDMNEFLNAIHKCEQNG